MIQEFINKQFYNLFIFTFIFGLVLYGTIGFDSIDEICACILLILFIFATFKTPDWAINKSFLAVSSVFIFYTIYSFYIHSNSAKGIISDMIIQFKPYLAFFAVYYLCPVFSSKQKDLIKKIILIISFFMFLIGCASLVYPLAFRVTVGHVAYFAAIITASSLLYYYCSEGAKIDKMIFILILAIGLFSATSTNITTAKVDADNTDEVIALINEFKPDVVLNVALPYQDLTIMDACLACKVPYVDTANYECEDTDNPEWRKVYEERCKRLGFTAYFDYSWQWAYREKYKEAGITALLGTGFDPGVTSVFTAYAQKHYFDEIHTIDILDCNGGDHGYPFATNFNPEINLREVSAPGSYWEDGHWVEIPAMSIKREYNFEGVGMKDMYLLHHEEIEALAANIPHVKRIRFFMTFGQSYLTHMKCLENVGMLRTDPVEFNGQEIVPIQFLKALLPDPASLGPRTVGKTNIGCIFTGIKDGKEKKVYIYNVCDHQECYREVGSQAISYTTGVPAMIGTMLVAKGLWNKPGVFTTDEFDPDPYMDALNKYGLPWVVDENPVLVD